MKLDKISTKFLYEKSGKPYKKITMLEIYLIFHMNIVDTKFEKSVMLELENCHIHLLRWFSSTMAQDAKMFNEFRLFTLYIKVCGNIKLKFSTLHLIKFLKIKPSNNCI